MTTLAPNTTSSTLVIVSLLWSALTVGLFTRSLDSIIYSPSVNSSSTDTMAGISLLYKYSDDPIITLLEPPVMRPPEPTVVWLKLSYRISMATSIGDTPSSSASNSTSNVNPSSRYKSLLNTIPVATA